MKNAKTKLKHQIYGSYAVAGIAFAAVFLKYRLAYAYIDPGTSSVVYSAFAYMLGGAAVVIAVLISPLKKVYNYIKKKIKKNNAIV